MRLPLSRTPRSPRSGSAPAPSTSTRAAGERGLVASGGLAIPYRVIRSARRRRTLELRLDRDGVRVAAPVRTPIAEIEGFVRSKTDWIRKQLATMPPTPRAPRFATGETVPYLGRPLPMEVVEGRVRRPRVQLDLLGLRVIVPPGGSDGGNSGEVVAAALRDWHRGRAAEELPQRAAAWAARIGCEPSRVVVRDQKRRWGSCAPDGTIRLNWRLIMMPPSLVDYVIIHELTHLRHPHHQPTFWAAVSAVMPHYRARRRALQETARALPY